MEHRDDLEQILLNGLPQEERQDVVASMARATAEKLAHLESMEYDLSQPAYNRARHARKRDG